ncbi:GMC family oxidoreductase [Pseudomonas sp. NPDC087342]|uniref:GMC family oxidoreductase n=1 Tax=Pseudomonas sp. NPDC087342 TaxID=3364437 RepID=UPI003820CAA8
MTHSYDDVDVVIVGAGPSGAVSAHTLASKGFKVLCLEQGDWVSPADYPGNKPEFELLLQKKWSWNPNKRERPEDYPMNLDGTDVTPIMFAGVGGSSLLYGAQWLRLLPSDFRVKTLDGICDDWPIDYYDLEPYYNRVDAFLGVAGLGGDPAYPPQDYEMPPHPLGKGGMVAAKGLNKLGWHWWPGTQAIPTWKFKAMEKCVRWGVCETGCPAGAKASFDLGYWPHATAAGAQLVTGARVRKITTNDQGLADSVIWIDREGVEHTQRAKIVIMAANGIGTARLLLLSASNAFPDGLANSSGLVGKNLMLHPNNEVLGLYDEDIESWKGPAGQLIYSLEFYETDKSRGFYRGSKMNLMPVPGVLRLVSTHENLPFEERWGSALHDITKYAGHALSWAGNIEDLPEETNRVILDPVLKDSDGIPAPRIEYKISENTQKNLDFALERMAEMHLAAGAKKIFKTPLWREAPGHILGTARMGDDPKASVVNKYGRSHDVKNLFIVDGSVMVTSGAVNPTATIAALALRTAEHIIDTAAEMGVTV